MWHGWTRARNAQQYLETTEALCADMASVDFPFLCLHGQIDTMTDPEGSKKLYDEAQARLCRPTSSGGSTPRGARLTASPSLQSTDKELHIIPDRWHVLLKEPGCKELGKKVVAWIAARA